MRVDVESRADRNDVRGSGANAEGPLRVLGDTEDRLALDQLDRAQRAAELRAKVRTRVQFDDGAVFERDGTLLAQCRLVSGTEP